MKCRFSWVPLGLLALLLSAPLAMAEEYAVHAVMAADVKPVVAEVDSAHRAVARARISGTITKIKVTEGMDVKKGEVLAIISDPKQPHEIEAMDAQLKSMEADRAQAASDVKRYKPLVSIGAISQMKMDELNTRLNSLSSNVRALKAQRDSAVAHRGEGAVLAPMRGRVLNLPVPQGNVVMMGDTVAELTAGDLILKIHVPERYAAYLTTGAPIRITSSDAEGHERVREGHIKKVYPEVQDGRVAADVTVNDLSEGFIGKRMTAYVPTANRKAIYVPKNFITLRHGLHYVTLKSGEEIVVELGLEDEHGIEVLSGLNDGDVLVSP